MLIRSKTSPAAVRRRMQDEELYRGMRAAAAGLEESLLAVCRSAEDPALREDLTRVVTAGGKRLRPMLCWLCAGMGTPDEKLPPLMEMLELMHTASLIHDDAVDLSPERRGAATVNAVRGVPAAVSAGDFLLGRAMERLKLFRGTGIDELLSRVSAEMCRGEFLQQRERCRPGSRETYFRRVHCKTASFLSASCVSGAIAGGLTAEERAGLSEFGEHLGIAFQLRDDLLDLDPPPDFGKPAGQDLQDGVVTLPVLYALEDGLSAQARKLLSCRDKSPGETEMLLREILKTDAGAQTQREIEAHSALACRALDGLRETPQRESLRKLALALADRER